jgi:hypothetical protein
MKYLLTIVILLLKLVAFCQEPIYYAYPTSNTKKELIKLIPKTHKTEDSFFYIIHLLPANCPRCEGLINPLINGLKINPKDIFVVYDIDDAKCAIKYNRIKNFITKNIVVDKSSRLFNSIDFPSDYLAVPFFYKIRKVDYEFLYSCPLLGITVGDDLFKKIILDTVAIQILNEVNKITPLLTENILLPKVEPNKIIKLVFNNDTMFKPKTLYNFDNYFIWLDEIFSTIYKINLNGEVISEIRVSELEFEKFVSNNVPKDIFYYLKSNNILNVIYLNLTETFNNKINIISSLPVVTLDINGTDSSIDYSNEMAIVSKSLGKDKSIEINKIVFPQEYSDLGYNTKHSYLKINNNKQYVLPLYKGWPVIGSSDYDSLNIKFNGNPFSNEFYNETSTFYLINGNDYNKYGQLSEFSKQNKLGYYLNKPAFDIDSDFVYFNDGVDNVIYEYSINTAKIINKYTLPIKSINKVELKYIRTFDDSFVHRIDYFKQFDNLNYEFIDKLLVDKNQELIYYTIKNSKSGYIKFNIYNIKEDINSSYIIPINNKGHNAEYCNLYRNNDTINLIWYNSVTHEIQVRFF